MLALYRLVSSNTQANKGGSEADGVKAGCKQLQCTISFQYKNTKIGDLHLS